MEKIINYNFEKLCNNKYTHIIRVKINDIKFIIPICKKHAKEYKNKLINDNKLKIEKDYIIS